MWKRCIRLKDLVGRFSRAFVLCWCWCWCWYPLSCGGVYRWNQLFGLWSPGMIPGYGSMRLKYCCSLASSAINRLHACCTTAVWYIQSYITKTIQKYIIIIIRLWHHLICCMYLCCARCSYTFAAVVNPLVQVDSVISWKVDLAERETPRRTPISWLQAGRLHKAVGLLCGTILLLFWVVPWTKQS